MEIERKNGKGVEGWETKQGARIEAVYATKSVNAVNVL